MTSGCEPESKISNETRNKGRWVGSTTRLAHVFCSGVEIHADVCGVSRPFLMYNMCPDILYD